MSASRGVGAMAMAIAWSLTLGLGPGPNPARFEFRQTHMGSEFKIVLYTSGEAEARRASDAAFARIAALDKALSDYEPESELMRLCDKAGGPAVPVSEDLFRCLQLAQTMSARSDGAFDATIGPVGRLGVRPTDANLAQRGQLREGPAAGRIPFRRAGRESTDRAPAEARHEAGPGRDRQGIRLR